MINLILIKALGVRNKMLYVPNGKRKDKMEVQCFCSQKSSIEEEVVYFRLIRLF